jgi:hypothetical protein
MHSSAAIHILYEKTSIFNPTPSSPRFVTANHSLPLQVLLSPDYLPAMRRRRSADPLGDTASNLGNAMDELMRHQPSLKQAATAAIIKLLEQVR